MTTTPGKIEFANREDWLAHRQTGLGGSDILAALGMDRYKSTYTLYREKRGEVEPEPVDGVDAELGHFLEPFMAKWFQQETGRVVADPGDFTIYEHPDRPHLRVTPDYLFSDGGHPLEIKTTGNPEQIALWKAGETPAAAGAQINMQMEVLGVEHGAVAALTFGRKKERVWFDVGRNDTLIEAMVPRLDEFWERVQNGDPPPIDGSESTRQTIYRMHPTHSDDSGSVVELPPDIVSVVRDLDAAKRLIAEYTEDKKQRENQIREWIGDAQYGQFGNIMYSNSTTERKDTIKVAMDQRAALVKYGIPFEDKPGSKFRTLRRKSIR
jgi:putative phage-type endonuclease